MAIKLPKSSTTMRLESALKSAAQKAAVAEGLGTLTAIVSVALIDYLRRKGHKTGGAK